MKKINYLSGSLTILLLFISLSGFQLFNGTSVKQKAFNKQLFVPHIVIENNTSNSVIYFSMAYYDADQNLITTHSGIAVSSGGSAIDIIPSSAATVNVDISVAVKTLDMYGVSCTSSYPNTTTTSGIFVISGIGVATLSANSGACR